MRLLLRNVIVTCGAGALYGFYLADSAQRSMDEANLAEAQMEDVAPTAARAGPGGGAKGGAERRRD